MCRTWGTIQLVCLGVGAFVTPSLGATPAPNRSPLQAPRPMETIVWVNTPSRVYHCPGSRFYGTTDVGEFMSEAAARGQGNRAAGGNGCPPGRAVPPTPRNRTEVWVNTQSGVYHCPGSRAYARTERGRFLPERVARQLGHEAAGGRRCR